MEEGKEGWTAFIIKTVFFSVVFTVIGMSLLFWSYLTILFISYLI